MLSAVEWSGLNGAVQHPEVPPNQGQEEKLHLDSHGSGYLLNLGNYLKKNSGGGGKQHGV